MKKNIFKTLCMALCAVLCYSCTNEDEHVVEDTDGYTSITFNVSGMQITQESLTRASLNEAFSMLELVLYSINEDGSYTKYKEVDQTSSSTTFGVITLENIKCGTYRLVALGHNDTTHPDIDDPTDI